MKPVLVAGLVACLSLTGCGRPLTENERAFAATITGDALNVEKVRLVRGAPVAAVTFQRKARPRVTCRERILPPAKTEIVTAKPAAVALFNRVFFTRDWYIDDFLRKYPDTLILTDAMLLAHELTHVWQWQHRKLTGYTPWRAAAEQIKSDDPYLFDLDTSTRFLDFGYEQQGTIVEEYVCCRALEPAAARTKRLHDLLSAVMPVRPLPADGQREADVLIPWKGAQIDGICS
jgi:hypothetical protein